MTGPFTSSIKIGLMATKINLTIILCTITNTSQMSQKIKKENT
ncbi:9479_t:CDS:2 [Entrophospora sp. SA101]|nr:9479_t:CDS:2 [Entrophospora sp. SA101]